MNKMIRNSLHYLMTENNLNISQLSKATNISRNTISNLINNFELAAYKTETLSKLCSYFGIELMELLDFDDETIRVETISDNSDKNKRPNTFNFEVKMKNQFDVRGTFSGSLSVKVGYVKADDPAISLPETKRTDEVPILFVTTYMDSFRQALLLSDKETKQLNEDVVRGTILNVLDVYNNYVISLLKNYLPEYFEKNRYIFVVTPESRIDTVTTSSQLFDVKNNDMIDEFYDKYLKKFEMLNKSIR